VQQGERCAFDGLVNARDLGGLRRRDGTRTPHGVFFRSDNVDRLTPAGWEQAARAGIRTVVDLRQPSERKCDVATRPDWVATVEVDLDGLENQAVWKDYWDNGLVGTALPYLPHLAAMPERAGAAARRRLGRSAKRLPAPAWRSSPTAGTCLRLKARGPIATSSTGSWQTSSASSGKAAAVRSAWGLSAGPSPD